MLLQLLVDYAGPAMMWTSLAASMILMIHENS